jgi:hypothetical protein
MDVVQSMQERPWFELFPGGSDPDPLKRLQAAGQAFPHSGGGDPKTPKHDRIRVNSDRYASWPAEHKQAIRGLLDDHLRKYGYSAAPS